MIPQFPNFKKLELSDKEEIEKFTHLYPPYSDYNFASLWTYNIDDAVEISVLNNNLVIIFIDYLSNERFYSFMGTENVLETTDMLIKDAENKNLLKFLKFIPEEAVTDDLKKTSKFLVEEDRNHFDYILSISELANLEGSKHYGKKKQLNIFEKTYPDSVYQELDLSNPKIAGEITNVFIKWRYAKGKTEENTSSEFSAINRAIKHHRELKIYAIGIYNNNELIGFAIADLEHTHFVEFHFVKADLSYKGIFAALYIYLAKNLHLKNYEFLNIEQDLGIPGIRMSKLQWNPVHFLKKYTVERKIS